METKTVLRTTQSLFQMMLKYEPGCELRAGKKGRVKGVWTQRRSALIAALLTNETTIRSCFIPEY